MHTIENGFSFMESSAVIGRLGTIIHFIIASTIIIRLWAFPIRLQLTAGDITECVKLIFRLQNYVTDRLKAPVDNKQN